MRWPVIQRPLPARRIATALPMSSGRPVRPLAVCCATYWFTAAPSRTAPPKKSVSVAPGATEVTAIPLGRRSSALFIAAYARLPAATCRIRLVEMLMMAP